MVIFKKILVDSVGHNTYNKWSIVIVLASAQLKKERAFIIYLFGCNYYFLEIIKKTIEIHSDLVITYKIAFVIRGIFPFKYSFFIFAWN